MGGKDPVLLPKAEHRGDSKIKCSLLQTSCTHYHEVNQPHTCTNMSMYSERLKPL